MTLTLELPTEVEQVLAARAQAQGVSLPKYLQDLAARDAAITQESRPERPLQGYGKYAGLGLSVADLLRERHEEARREMERDEPRSSRASGA